MKAAYLYQIRGCHMVAVENEKICIWRFWQDEMWELKGSLKWTSMLEAVLKPEGGSMSRLAASRDEENALQVFYV